ncbi:hypothetical protein [Nocardia arthritidis]|uniref:hypothetical protein n=1 Tax=Nocardia arthritidis TaxID=228602 RepID=UPI0012EEA425|nr:hypothetical protein [Nocardia arthritidis]
MTTKGAAADRRPMALGTFETDLAEYVVNRSTDAPIFQRPAAADHEVDVSDLRRLQQRRNTDP